MANKKNTRIEQTPTQSNPYLANPSDFEVVGGDTAPGHGQRGATGSEYQKLLRQADSHGKSPLGKKA